MSYVHVTLAAQHFCIITCNTSYITISPEIKKEQQALQFAFTLSPQLFSTREVAGYRHYSLEVHRKCCMCRW